jgi:hypothetical protein
MNKEVLEGNKLIAEFMGWEKYEDDTTYKFPNLYPIHNIDDKENTGWTSEQISNAEFHTRWDWLMPVIGKISNECEEPEELDELKYALLCNDIETAWKFVVNYLD